MKKTALRHLLATVAGLTTILLPISVLAAPGDLYEADRGTNTIFRFTPDGTKTTFISGLNQPFRLAFDSSGNLFVSELAGMGAGAGIISQITPMGVKTTFAAGLSNPTGLAFDAFGNVFEADFGSNMI